VDSPSFIFIKLQFVTVLIVAHQHLRKLSKKDGSTFPVEVTANYLEYDQEKYVFAFVKDIAGRRRKH